MEKRGHEVRILTLRQEGEEPGENEEASRKREPDVWRLRSVSAGRIYPKARVICGFGRRQREEILDWEPDVIHSQCEFSTFLPARMLARQLGVPLVHTYHTVYEDYTHYFSPSARMGRRLVQAFTRKIASQAQAVIAPTQKVAQLLEGYGVSARVYTVPTGLDLEKFWNPVPEGRLLSLRRRLGIPEGSRVLLFLGRMAKEKNLEELLELFDSLGRTDTVLVAAGDGPDRKRLMAYAARLGSRGRILFPGMVDRERVSEYYQMADLFVSCSTSETQGLTYIEALSSGLPALCRRDACLDGVIADGVNGGQFETQEEFLCRAQRLLDTPGELAALGRAARQRSAEYSLEAFAGRAEAVYRACIAEEVDKRESVVYSLI